MSLFNDTSQCVGVQFIYIYIYKNLYIKLNIKKKTKNSKYFFKTKCVSFCFSEYT